MLQFGKIPDDLRREKGFDLSMAKMNFVSSVRMNASNWVVAVNRVTSIEVMQDINVKCNYLIVLHHPQSCQSL
jgi:hypothetical protein